MATSTAIFAGQCFLGFHDLVRGLPGVLSTRVAYPGAGDHTPDDRNNANQAVAVEVTYDSEQTDYQTLVDFFFQVHDQTSRGDSRSHG